MCNHFFTWTWSPFSCSLSSALLSLSRLGALCWLGARASSRTMFSLWGRRAVTCPGGSSGATVRMYVDSFCSDQAKVTRSAGEMLAPVVQLGLEISQLRELTGRQEPTVVT